MCKVRQGWNIQHSKRLLPKLSEKIRRTWAEKGVGAKMTVTWATGVCSVQGRDPGIHDPPYYTKYTKYMCLSV